MNLKNSSQEESMYQGRKAYAIVLAAGSGRRMHSKTKKQFMEVLGKPLFAWSADCFDRHPSIDGIVLVTGEEDVSYMEALTSSEGACTLEKLVAVIPGGKERYHSVYAGLRKIAELENMTMETVDDEDPGQNGCGKAPASEASGEAKSLDPLILIHDGARPMLTEAMIDDALRYAEKYQAAVIGMPVKDTIKILDPDHFVKETPERSSVWLMQTPQSFDFSLIHRAYTALIEQETRGQLMIPVTDDAMVVEAFTGQRVKVIPGSYQNIKVTTPEDLRIAELYLS